MMGRREDSPVRRATLVRPGPAGRSLERLVTEDRGTTLTEIIITLFLTSLVVGVLGTAFYQFFTATRLGNDTLMALHDLEIAGVWLSKDAREALSFTPGSGTVYGTFDCGDSTVEYSYDAGNTAVVRTVGGQSRMVARHIAAQNDVQFSASDRLVTITVTSTSGAVSRSTTLEINMRTD